MLSGVNRGANLGIETVFSGTVGGAMTGMMLGIPAIALSQAWTDRAHVRWDTAATLGPPIVRRLWEIGWSAATCLSVNFPDLPPNEAGPLTLARQGAGTVQGMDVEARTDPRGLTYYWVGFRRGERDQGPESDIEALNAGRITVTPLRYDRTDEEAYRSWGGPCRAEAAKVFCFNRVPHRPLHPGSISVPVRWHRGKPRYRKAPFPFSLLLRRSAPGAEKRPVPGGLTRSVSASSWQAALRRIPYSMRSDTQQQQNLR